MSTFVERWHKETSSFHLPVGEVTITLDDVASLLHQPIIGAFHIFEQLHVDDVVVTLVELLEVSIAEAKVETIQCHGSYIRLSWLRNVYQTKMEACHWIVATQAYLLYLLGYTLFVNKRVTHVHMVFLDALHDLTQSRTYTQGTAALVHMYDNLNEAPKSTARQLAGYITLLQVSSHVNKTFFHQCWVFYVIAYFNEYVCKISLVLDLQKFPVC